jgi:lipoprotein-anchoring transpeptidase ErfK/SrfK
MFIAVVLCGALWSASPGAAQTVAEHGGDCWWCARESFNISDPEQVWKYLMADVTVLNVDAQTPVYLLDAPNGERVKKGQYSGFFYGASASVHVLSNDGSWALIEGYDMSNDLLRGYVRASLLKTVTPSALYGIVVDKQTQRLHLYQNGKEISQLLVSTGLPEPDKPYNETAAGEFLITSWTGGFWSGNMYCDLALRFNGGDLLHLVPALINKDGSYNHDPFEPLLGTRASHGCIRVQRARSPEGINMQWLWDNLKRNTKIIVWDDSDRPMFYPDDDLELYYNPNKGAYYHADQRCASVKDRYLPLTPLRYADLREKEFSKLTACPSCEPPESPQDIDAVNEKRGFTREYAQAVQQAQESGLPVTVGAPNGSIEVEDIIIMQDDSIPSAFIIDDVLTIDDGEWDDAP